MFSVRLGRVLVGLGTPRMVPRAVKGAGGLFPLNVNYCSQWKRGEWQVKEAELSGVVRDFEKKKN